MQTTAMPIGREELDVVLRLFDDRRALIAWGKVQRWEVVKWVVAANVALGAASAGLERLQALFFVFAVLVAIIGIVLLWHYNLRMTRVRGSLRSINAFLSKNVIDINTIADADFVRTKDTEYDRQELTMFYLALMLSILPTLLSWLATWTT